MRLSHKSRWETHNYVRFISPEDNEGKVDYIMQTRITPAASVDDVASLPSRSSAPRRWSSPFTVMIVLVLLEDFLQR